MKNWASKLKSLFYRDCKPYHTQPFGLRPIRVSVRMPPCKPPAPEVDKMVCWQLNDLFFGHYIKDPKNIVRGHSLNEVFKKLQLLDTELIIMSEIKQLQDILNEIPEENVIDRFSVESRLNKIEKELQGIKEQLT